MTLVERLKAFLFRKRRWQWIAVGIALVALGQYLEAQKIEPSSVAQQGAALTRRLHDRLAAVQPGAIADLYTRAGRDRHGIEWCGSTAARETLTPGPAPHLERPYGALPADLEILRKRAARARAAAGSEVADPIGNVMAPLERDVGLPVPRPTTDSTPLLREGLGARPFTPRPSDMERLRATIERERLATRTTPGDIAAATKAEPHAWNCDRGWLATLDTAALNLRVTPEIAWAVWQAGGWSTMMLLALTLAGMTTLILAVWREKDIGCAAVPITLFVLALGPAIAGGLFWLMLQLLLGLTVVLGHVLAGLALVLAWIAGLSKVVMIGIETLTKSDEAKENYDALKASLGAEKPPAD
ncbi:MULTISPECIES: hypothetical protein [Sphingomonas]|uniref:hypothetical protein n=1 Tax=Sphingomonas TaxID=13687 RepID=UPI000834AD79|nr:hypothetical protein [Sphingomonas sp. CCH10-B3]